MSKPDDALLAKLSQLSPAQREALLNKLKQQKSQQTASRPPETAITPIDRRDLAQPLSFAQQRLWFLEKLYPESATYNIAAAIELNGALNSALLEQSFRRIITRHESLRTAFIESANGAQQKVLAKVDWHMPEQALSPAELSQQLERDAATPFDLSQAPLLRARLYHTGEQQAVLSIVMHHIISDAWSSQILLAEVSRVYSALVQGLVPALPAPKVHYIDYSQWQKTHLEQAYCQQQRSFWQEKLANVSNLQLASDFPRPAVMTQNGASLSLSLDKNLARRFQSLCLAHNATTYNGLMSVFQCLLYRYTQQYNFAIGTPVAGRIHSDLEPLIGFFVNTQAIVCDIEPGISFSQLLRKVRKTSIDAQDKQDIPFEQLVDTLPLARDSSHTPVFQVFFSYQAGQLEDAVQLPGIHARFIDIETHSAKFDLSLIVSDRNHSLHCHFEYNRDIFSQANIEQLSQHFNRLLLAVCEQADSPIESLAMLDRDETRQLLDTSESVPYPACSIVQLFEQQAASHPDKIAVVQGQEQLSFSRLNEKANRLAHYLIGQGVKAGDFIGLCFPPSIELSVALLASLKTGAAYVPLDPSYPAERLNYMMANAGVKVLLASHRNEVAGISATQSILIDTLALQHECSDNPKVSIDLASPLYAIFTSGSTGAPKAAVVSHANENNLLHWYANTFNLNQDDRFLVFSAIGFDLTQKNLLAPLCMGAQLHFSVAEQYDPQALLNTIAQDGITWINCAPSAFYPLTERSQVAKLASVKKLFFGGEPIRLDLMQDWIQSAHFNAHITNMYGPTECTDIATSFTVIDARHHQGIIPIGTASANVNLYVLDRQLHLLPQGAIGELYIGGSGVGLGYLNNPEMTAKHFIANPFRQGETLYKTGDLVRYNAAQQLEFISRVDNQLKIRGFRIETGEIEAQLRLIDGVNDAVVSVREYQGQAQLFAFICSDKELMPAFSYRKQLQKQLPDFMIPVAFTRIPTIPLSPNGKVDRNKLPVVDLAQMRANHEYVAPTNATETALADIWQDVLGMDKASIRDNFFELGGNSLSATQVISRIRQQFSLDLPLRTLFEINTIEGLAEIIMAMSSTQQSATDEEFEEGTL